jgi:CHAT domain-containing protein/tetratricopeptide (TPR) repeat protein
MYRPDPTLALTPHGNRSACISGRPAIRTTLRFIALVFCLLLLSDAGPVIAPRADAQTSAKLSEEREFTSGDLHTYRFNLTAGQFIRAVFDQRGIDISLTLRGPDEQTLLEVDNLVGAWGPESLFYEVETSGPYTIEVRPRLTWPAPGRYVYRLEARRPTPEDDKRIPAEKLFAEGTQRLMSKTADSLSQGIGKYEDALRVFRSVNDRLGEATTLSTIGAVYHATGQEQDAIRYFDEALPLMRASQDRAGEARVMSNLAQVHFVVGDRQRALKYFTQAMPIFFATGDKRTAAYTLNNIGFVYDAMGESQHALVYFNQALTIFQEVKDSRGEAYTLNNIGLTFDALGNKKRAHVYFERALESFRLIQDCSEAGAIFSNAALDYLNSGDKQKALDYLNQALIIQRSINDSQGAATTLNNIGFVYQTMGKLQPALLYFNQALALHREAQNLKGEGDTLSNLMFTWHAQNKAPLAIFFGKQAVNAYQAARSKIPALDVEMQQSFLKSRDSSYRQLADLLIAAGRILEGQQVLGMLKEEEYFQFVRRSGDDAASLKGKAAMTPAEADLEKRYQEIADHVAAIGAQKDALLAKSNRTPEENTLLAKLQADLRIANEEFEKFLTQLTGELASANQSADKVKQIREAEGLQDTLRELGQGVVALYTLIGDEKYRIILITPDVQLKGEYPIKAEDLYAKIADFREVLKNPNMDPRPQAQELYKILIGPIARDLKNARAETLMWSLDGVLRYIPIAALHDGEKYLIESYRNVVFTPASLSNLKDQPETKWKGIGFGVSKAQSDFAALPAVPEELHAIFREEGADRILGGIINGKILLDENFTEATLTDELQQRYRLVHIASHFQFSPGDETNSFLLLGDGSHYSLARIKTTPNLFSGVDLLALSACNTASSSAGANGKEVDGFAELAQRKGAKAVMASLWQVSDESTRLLMQQFYRGRDRQAGMTKAEALQRAQLALLRGEVLGDINRSTLARKAGSNNGPVTFTPDPKAPFAHPYYWAPFILIGNWR